MQRSLSDFEPLPAEAFYVLYESAVSGGTETDRLQRAMAVLGTGRLGLTPGEVLHLHEGWVDWQAGVVRVPAHDPCACVRCVQKTKDTHEVRDTDRAASMAAATRWQSGLDGGARAIPFDWSSRLTGLLVAFLDRFDHFPGRRLDVVLEDVAETASGLDPAAVTPGRLRASAAGALAEFGYPCDDLARVLGVAPDEVEPFVRRAAPSARQRADVPSHLGRYRVLANPGRIANEPFVPTEFDDDARSERANRRDVSSRRISNPRPPHPECSTDPATVPDRFDVYETDGRLLTTEGDAVQSLAAASVRRRDTRQPPQTLETPPHLAAGSDGTGDRGSRPEDGADGGPDDGNRAQTGETDGTASGFSERGIAEVCPSPWFSKRVDFVSPLVTDGRIGSGTVAVGPDAVAFDLGDVEGTGAPTFALEPADIRTVAPDHTPSAVRDRFDRSCGLKCAVGDEETVVVVEPPAADRRQFLQALFRCLLDRSEVVYTHPVREGGRVLADSAAASGLLSVRDERLVVEDGGETVCEIALGSVTDVGTTTQTLDAGTYRSIEIQHIPGTRTVTTAIAATSPRETDLLTRYVKLHYSSLRNRLQEFDLSGDTKRMLVSLHSMGDADVQTDALAELLGMDGDRFGTLVSRLAERGIVRGEEAGLELTPLGRVAVAEKIDDVNL